MKQINLAILLTIMTSVFQTPSSSAYETDEGGGFGGGNGGDVFVDRFTSTARNLDLILMQVRSKEPNFCPEAKDFGQAVKETQVRSVPFVIIDGYEHDARNFSDRKLIEISRKRQIELVDDLGLLIILFHEYLGIMGIEGTNDTRFSSACIQGLVKRGHNVKKIVSPIETGVSLMESLASGAYELRCEDSKKLISIAFGNFRGRFAITTQGVAPEIQKSLPLMVGYGSQPIDQKSFLNLFKSQIDVGSAQLKVRFSTLNKSPQGEEIYFPPSLEMNLESSDLANWNMELMGEKSISYLSGKLIQAKSLTLECVPSKITLRSNVD
jgi:hypothetical protein